MSRAYFAAGCFWSVELEFSKIKGVINTHVGFMGGNVSNPSYKQVCNDNTGHYEVVRLEYDPYIISYQKLLDAFWSMHDPTMDIEKFQHKSAIFFVSADQCKFALKSKQNLEETYQWPGSINTKIMPANFFYPAEQYHQQYLLKRGIKRVGF